MKLKNNCNEHYECCQHFMRVYDFIVLLQDIIECKNDQSLNKT